jgi:hypothetical protein
MTEPFDNILNNWILITKDVGYNEWMSAYLHGGIQLPPKYDSLAGSLFYIEGIVSTFATGRFVESLLNSVILNLSNYEYILAPRTMVEPSLNDVYNRVVTQKTAPIDIFPSIFKEFANAKKSNETSKHFLGPSPGKTDC